MICLQYLTFLFLPSSFSEPLQFTPDHPNEKLSVLLKQYFCSYQMPFLTTNSVKVLKGQ